MKYSRFQRTELPDKGKEVGWEDKLCWLHFRSILPPVEIIETAANRPERKWRENILN
jgi:hypothetical protein